MRKAFSLLALAAASNLGIANAESLAVFLGFAPPDKDEKPPPARHRYLLISTPLSGKVVYVDVGANAFGKDRLPSLDHKPQTLLEGSPLKSPQGLAVERRSGKLYIADPDALGIFACKILDHGGTLKPDKKGAFKVVDNIEARWVAVDGQGNVFYTDERDSLIMRLSSEKLAKGITTGTVLYSGIDIPQVSTPGGIAVDNFHVYWGNKNLGSEHGSVVRGSEHPPATNVQTTVNPIALNTDKVYGVCLAQRYIYYTDNEQVIWGVAKNGGKIVQINDKLIKPRGCAYDGEGTMFVADKASGSVYSFASNMQDLNHASLTRVASFEDAFGLTVLSDPPSGAQSVEITRMALFVVALCAMRW